LLKKLPQGDRKEFLYALSNESLIMLQKEITIINKLGLHARAAAKFVTLASQFESDIQVLRNNNEVNGKSIMGVMMLAASKGSSITLEINGVDEKKALSELECMINDRFGENE